MAEVLYGDYDHTGIVDDKGKIKVLTEDDALNQSLKLWIVSKEGDLINSPARGGYVYPNLLKSMSEDNADEISASIQEGLAQDFFPEVEVVEISVEPNYQKKYWDIEALLYFPNIDYKINFVTKVKSQG